MQHEDRESYIDSIVGSLQRDLTANAKKRIKKHPYEPYNPDVIFDLMGQFAIQRRTAKEWLICAQLRLVKQLNKP